ncbi:MAG: hypothetical protein OEW60_06995 [Thiovulaceae bacterium]|nr:hypothetical protein [Sulfurimonadaceae bacterium]
MEGTIIVTYTIICDNDVNKEIDINEVFKNEKFLALFKREYAKGLRNVSLDFENLKGTIAIEKERPTYTCKIDKDDFADALSLAEDDAKSKKLLKGNCQMVELLDIKTEEKKKKK